MTLVIDVGPELESRLEEEAAKQGVALAEFVRGVLERQVMPPKSYERSPMTAQERAAWANAIVGKYAHIPGSVEDFLQRKQEEIDLEEERFERWQRSGE